MYEDLVERLRDAHGGPDGIKMCSDAADAIEKLRAELDRVTRERDAAVEDIKSCYDIQGDEDDHPIYDFAMCAKCTHYTDTVDRENGEELACDECQNASQWQWRGLQGREE